MTDNDITAAERPFIRFENVTVKTNGGLCFRDTSLVMEYGQNWAVFGPTGSGKSILADAILHKVSLFSGRILFCFEGEPPRPFLNKNEAFLISPLLHRDILQRYGGYHQARWQSFGLEFVPQVSEFLSGRSIEHVSPYEVTPLLINETVYEERRKKAAALLRIERLMDEKLISLSNGEMRKVLIARALIQNPRLLLIDDPFYGLDARSRRIFSDTIASMLKEEVPKILLFISDAGDIPEGVTHVILIENKNIIRSGARSMVFRDKACGALLSGAQAPPKTQANRGRLRNIRMRLNNDNEIIVEMRNVNITYDKKAVLKNISWVVRRGEKWALLGHNGAGKTTLLSLISGDNPQAYSNEIYLFGSRRGSGESIWDIKKRIGCVSSELLYYYESSGSCLEVVLAGFFDTIGLYNDVSAGQIKEARSLMEEMQIGNISDHEFSSVSIGERKLALLARALVKNPLLLLLDEPCQGLDRHYSSLFNSLVEKLCGQGEMSAVYVTHNEPEIPPCFDRVLELYEGETVP